MRKLQQGFSLISAIFLLVVIAALGTFAVTLSTTQQQSSALDVMGARAYQAARAGIEWAAFHVANDPAPATCSTNFALNSLGGTLAPFSVEVTCAAASSVEGTSTFWNYDVTATAKTAGSPGDTGYVERVISVKLGK
jgi:MSHA biogenesis protein MshP